MRLVAVVAALLATTALARAEPAAGGIKGTVIFEGEAPDRPAIDRTSDPACGKTTRLSDDIVVTKGKLAGVVVRVTGGTPPPPRSTSKDPLPPVVLEQTDCAYAPRVFVLEPGQGATVRNRDNTFHTVTGTLRGKQLFNKPQPRQAADIALGAPDGSPGEVLELACNVHPWMHAYGVLADNAFHAVTGEDGTFEITGLAPGKYTLEAWHPILGTRTLDVVIGRGPNKAIANARLSFRRP